MTRPANIAAPIAKLVTIIPLSIIPKIPPGRRPCRPGAYWGVAPNQRPGFYAGRHFTIAQAAAGFQF